MTFTFVSVVSCHLCFAVSDSLMEPYRKLLHTYLSLSGPHLGYLYSTNSLFNSGLWLLKKLKSTQVIHQLTLTDDPDLRHTFFYKLCKVQRKDLSTCSCIHIILLFGFGSKIRFWFFSAKDFGKFQENNSPVVASGMKQFEPSEANENIFVECVLFM